MISRGTENCGLLPNSDCAMKTRIYSALDRAALDRVSGDRADAGSDFAEDAGVPDEESISDFPAECLPPVLESIVRAIAGVCRVPLGMAAPMVLATASASLGRGLYVDAKLHGCETPPNLFILVCKTSGSGGSLSFRHATAPFFDIERTLRQEFEKNEKPRLDAEHEDVTQQIDELKRRLRNKTGAEREQIVAQIAECNANLAALEPRRAGKLLHVSDVTSEGLAAFLVKHDETLAHFDVDAGDALGTIMGRYNGNHQHTSDSLWLKGYTGEPHTVFRRHSDPIQLYSPCLAVLFVVTPDKLQELFRNSRLTTGGLLARFLVCDPPAPNQCQSEAMNLMNHASYRRKTRSATQRLSSRQ